MSGDESPGTTPGTPPEALAHSGSTTSGRAPEVSVVDLDMGYDKAAVLHHVSFTAPAGKTTVIMGPSGVGKSTLVKALLGLREVEHGDVVIGGRSVTDASPAELSTIRRGIGVMLGGNTVHDGSIFASKTAWENVRYPLEAHGYAPEEIEERAWRRMIEFGLTEHAHHRPDTMSGGQRRRLALARAFVADPQLLVLDDPGTALDLQNRQRIVESIRAARERTEATVLLTCHDIDMSRALGDHLVVLLEGRVVANGPAEELLEGIYETDEFDARFQFRASFDADTGNSLALVEADREFRSVFERLTFGALIGLGLIAVAGVVLIVILTAELVY